MMPWYLIGLICAIMCLGLIDWRYKLAFFHDARRTAATLAVAMGLFIVWDILGIRLGIFFSGDSSLVLPVRLAPEFPLEELFFLFLLTYVTLLVFRFLQKAKS